MKKYKIEDFDGLRYNPLRYLQGRNGRPPELGLAYPQLGDMGSWGEMMNFAGVREYRVTGWIMLLYQEGSPLIGIQNLTERKVIAGELVGFSKEGIEFTEGYSRVLSGEIELVNQRIIDFCRVQRNPDWAEYVVYEEIFYHQLGLAMGNKDPKEVNSMLANVKSVKTKMSELMKSFLHSDNSRALVRTFLEAIHAEGVRLRREHIAEALSEGKDPLEGYNAYGEYKKVYSKDINEDKYLELSQ